MISFIRIVTCIIFVMFSAWFFVILGMDGIGDWSCKEWLKLNETLKNESRIINMQDITFSTSISKQVRKQMGITKDYLDNGMFFENK